MTGDASIAARAVMWGSAMIANPELEGNRLPTQLHFATPALMRPLSLQP